MITMVPGHDLHLLAVIPVTEVGEEIAIHQTDIRQIPDRVVTGIVYPWKATV